MTQMNTTVPRLGEMIEENYDQFSGDMPEVQSGRPGRAGYPTITDPVAFQKAVRTVQMNAADKFGVQLSDQEARMTVVGKIPDKLRQRIPTLKKKDQDFKHKQERLTFEAQYFGRAGTGEETDFTSWGSTMDKDKLTLEEEEQDAKNFGLGTAPSITAEGLGFDVSVWLMEDGTPKTDQGSLSRRAQARVAIAAKGKDLYGGFTEGELETILGGGTLDKKTIKSVAGRGVAVAEQGGQTDWDLAHGFTRKNADGTTTQVIGANEIYLMVQERGQAFETFLLNGGDYVDPVTKVTLTHVGERAWQKSLLSDKTILENTRKYGGSITVQGQNGRPELLYISGTLAEDKIIQGVQNQLVKDGWNRADAIEVSRQTFEASMKHGRMVVDETDPRGFSFEYGPLFSEAEALVLAEELGISLPQLELFLQDEGQFQSLLASSILQGQAQTFTAGESALERGARTILAEDQRTWASAEAILDRQHEQLLADKRITWEEKELVREQSQARWTFALGSFAKVVDVGARVWLGTKMSQWAAGGSGADAFIRDAARWGEKSFWTTLGASDNQADKFTSAFAGGFPALTGVDKGVAGANTVLDAGGATEGVAAGGSAFGSFASAVAPPLALAAVAYAGWRGERSTRYSHLNDPSNVEQWTSVWSGWFDSLSYDAQLKVAPILSQYGARFDTDGNLLSLDFGDKGLFSGDSPGRFADGGAKALYDLVISEYPELAGFTASKDKKTLATDNPFNPTLNRLRGDQGEIIRGYRVLLDADVFNNPDSVSVREGQQISALWRKIPGEYRPTGYSQALPSREVQLQDLANFAETHGLLSTRGLQEAYAKLSQELVDIEDYQELDENTWALIGSIYDQASGMAGRPTAFVEIDPDTAGGASGAKRRTTMGQIQSIWTGGEGDEVALSPPVTEERPTPEALFRYMKNPDLMDSDIRDILFPEGYHYVADTLGTDLLLADAANRLEMTARDFDTYKVLPPEKYRTLLWMFGTGAKFTDADILNIFGDGEVMNDSLALPYIEFNRLVQGGAIEVTEGSTRPRVRTSI